jgi:hypothetical protein
MNVPFHPLVRYLVDQRSTEVHEICLCIRRGHTRNIKESNHPRVHLLQFLKEQTKSTAIIVPHPLLSIAFGINEINAWRATE